MFQLERNGRGYWCFLLVFLKKFLKICSYQNYWEGDVQSPSTLRGLVRRLGVEISWNYFCTSIFRNGWGGVSSIFKNFRAEPENAVKELKFKYFRKFRWLLSVILHERVSINKNANQSDQFFFKYFLVPIYSFHPTR